MRGQFILILIFYLTLFLRVLDVGVSLFHQILGNSCWSNVGQKETGWKDLKQYGD